ncbi:MAG: hypothetical protein HY909_03085 [Deltaproteobacteria bacterium]|nr:hypothetical protein [Deltaproteobacteria bacterium]
MKHLRGIVACAALVAAALAGCAADVAADPGTEVQELVGGCRTDCPRCRPGAICPLIACRLVCNGRRECLQTALCIQGYHWDTNRCACVRDSGPSLCSTDADCRVYSDYCTGCDCRALSTREPDPVCTGPGVRCFADPCLGRTAVCLQGSCSLQ